MTSLSALASKTARPLVSLVGDAANDGGGEKPFHQRIRLAMAARGMKQTDIDEQVTPGKSGYMSMLFKRGSDPKRDKLEAIATALDVDFGWLGTGAGHMDAHREQRARYPLAQRAVELFGPGGDGRWTEETCRGLLRVALKERSGDLEDVKAWRAIGDMLQKSLFEEIGEPLTSRDDERLNFDKSGVQPKGFAKKVRAGRKP